MPRQPRYLVANLTQHVVTRGVDRQPTFFSDADYRLYLRILEKAAQECGCRIHAYVLMSNHVHLLVTPLEKYALPRMMQRVGRNYVQTLNQRRERTGTLWEGRYRASPVQTDRYLLACQRYIELNPVRAGMVGSPADYRWSSYAGNALGGIDLLLSAHGAYLALGRDSARRRAAYRNLFADTLDPALLDTIRTSTNACIAIGGEEFKRSVGKMLGRPPPTGRKGRPRRCEPHDLKIGSTR